MSYKETCPGCNSHASDVAQARANGEPCPSCGLSAAASTEIMTVRSGQADEAVKAEFESLRLRADRAERDRNALQECLTAIGEALAELERHNEREARDDWNRR